MQLWLAVSGARSKATCQGSCTCPLPRQHHHHAQCFCFQKQIKQLFGYFHPEKIVSDNENKYLSGWPIRYFGLKKPLIMQTSISQLAGNVRQEQWFLFSKWIKHFQDTSTLQVSWFIWIINNFRGDLTDISARTKTLVRNACVSVFSSLPVVQVSCTCRCVWLGEYVECWYIMFYMNIK